jgi:formylglycine-generating enzyme required for sulfatase activity
MDGCYRGDAKPVFIDVIWNLRGFDAGRTVFAAGRQSLGCVDMAGNVCEWRAVLWGQNFENLISSFLMTLWLPGEFEVCGLRVLRGGAFLSVRARPV